MNKNRFIQGMKSDIKLSDEERKRIIIKSVDRTPWKLKCTIAMEEFAELQQQVSKMIRGIGSRTCLLEEMADAYICLKNLEYMFDIHSDEMQKAIDVKLDRERRYK